MVVHNTPRRLRWGRALAGLAVGAGLLVSSAGGAALAAQHAERATPATMTFEEERIEFEPGTDNATRQGLLADGVTDRWILNARAGQTFAITVDSADNNSVFAVFTPSRQLLTVVSATQAEANTFWTGTLPADGDYTVEVTTMGGAGYYQMKVWIDAGYMDPLGLVQRMRFQPGESSGEGAGTVIRASTDSWLLTARAGQTMNVTVWAPNGEPLTFDVFAPDFSPMTAPDTRTTWTGVLPVDGDYRVGITPLAGNTEYVIEVSIPGPGGGGGGGGGVIGDGPYEPDPDVDNPNPTPIQLETGGVTQRLSFEPGADHAIVRNVLAPGMVDTFILGAAEGQQLNAWVESDSGDVVISAFDPIGEILRDAGTDIYVESLSSSGDYEITVWNDSTIVSAYTFTVYIT